MYNRVYYEYQHFPARHFLPAMILWMALGATPCTIAVCPVRQRASVPETASAQADVV